jgi:hypothetical protein
VSYIPLENKVGEFGDARQQTAVGGRRVGPYLKQTGTYQTSENVPNDLEKPQPSAMRAIFLTRAKCKHWPRDHSHNASASLIKRQAGMRGGGSAQKAPHKQDS